MPAATFTDQEWHQAFALVADAKRNGKTEQDAIKDLGVSDSAYYVNRKRLRPDLGRGYRGARHTNATRERAVRIAAENAEALMREIDAERRRGRPLAAACKMRGMTKHQYYKWRVRLGWAQKGAWGAQSADNTRMSVLAAPEPALGREHENTSPAPAMAPEARNGDPMAIATTAPAGDRELTALLEEISATNDRLRALKLSLAEHVLRKH